MSGVITVPSIPVDPVEIAEADGILAVPSSAFGSDFQCQIEFSTHRKRFVLFYRVNMDGSTSPETRLAIARHVGHYALLEDELRLGTIQNTMHPDADYEAAHAAAEIGAAILAPDQFLKTRLHTLAVEFDLPLSVLAYQMSSNATKVPGEMLPQAFRIR